jgi:hypothetical protein
MTEPTGFTAVGMVGFTDQGTYSASASYVKNDLVHYGGNIWRCLIDDTTGITPTEGTNWKLFVGEPTNMAERIIAPLEVSPSENAYSVGEQLIFNDVLYKAKTAIAVGDVLVVDTNIELAPKVTSQIQTLTNKDTAIESEISDIVNVLGSKNLLPNNAITQVINGVTFTVNTDSTSIEHGVVTASGTASGGDAQLTLSTGNTIKKGTYILSGCPSGGKEGDVVKYALYLNLGGGIIYNDYGDGIIVTLANDVSNVVFAFDVANGQSVNGTVKPMLRPANIVDDTYVPYAMTNRELTKATQALGDSTEWRTTTPINNINVAYRKKNGIVFVRRNTSSATYTANTLVTIGNLPQGFRPSFTIQAVIQNDTAVVTVIISADGTVKILSTTGNGIPAFCLSFPL